MPDIQPAGFHSRAGFVSFPDSLFTQTVPKIQELAELKVVLYAAYLILRKRNPSTQGSESSVTYKQLKAEACRLSPELGEETLLQALNSAVEHGVLSRSTLNINEAPEDVYSLTGDSLQPTTINIFALYEQNIGMITPMIAEELKEAEKIYPPQWIEEALKEAVALNKRSWRYIARILERWASEGKDSGEYRRHTKTYGPDKYVKGKYGHFVKR
jgi:DnaD/phage-associated family protein